MSHRYEPFDFDLSSEQEARAAQLHKAALIIDMLYQGPLSTVNYPKRLEEKLERAIVEGLAAGESVLVAMAEPAAAAARGDLPEFREAWLASGVTGGNREVEPDPPWLLRSYGLAQAQFDQCDWMVKALKAEDFRRAKRAGQAAGYISTQGGPGESLQLIEDGYGLGLRMIQLTYNSQTKVGGGCTERTDVGVSFYGKRCIEMMNELGIIVDTGHCGRRTTLDACELSRKPVVASHTAVAKLCPHQRCKTDEELEALAATGGVIGLVLVPFFLNPRGEADLNDFLDHVDYLRDLVGVAHIGIGSDWPLAVPERILRDNFFALAGPLGFRPEHNIRPLSATHGFASYLDYPNITRGLVSRSYSDADIEAILGGNFLRVFEEVCG